MQIGNNTFILWVCITCVVCNADQIQVIQTNPNVNYRQ